MKRFAIVSFLVLLGVPFLFGCQPIVTDDTDNWITYEVRDGLEYNEAWMVVVDALLTRGYQFETLSRDDGYMKSEWLHETVESQGVEVRTRISVKFTYGRRTVRVKIDEDYIIGYKEPGVDIPRIADLKVELRDRLL
ncbi:MAG TPA: hypothetical protein PK916_13210 [Bacteroidota bacterium]|jgi:hypothetical protein|nr:hypothetical protein [Bacteroidota bacterium]